MKKSILLVLLLLMIFAKVFATSTEINDWQCYKLTAKAMYLNSAVAGAAELANSISYFFHNKPQYLLFMVDLINREDAKKEFADNIKTFEKLADDNSKIHFFISKSLGKVVYYDRDSVNEFNANFVSSTRSFQIKDGKHTVVILSLTDDEQFLLKLSDKSADFVEKVTFDKVDASVQCEVFGHKIDGKANVLKPATCTARGVQKSVCKVCGEEVSSPIEALGHKWVLTSKKEATCAEAGIENYKCSVCGATGKKDIDKKAHNFKLVENVKPTCDKEGKKVTKCSACGLENTELIPAKGHKIEFGMCTGCGLDFYSNSFVGGTGPAGGFIFYDCDADNNSGNKDGLKSSECGWRYLEAAPAHLSGEYSWGDDGKFGTKTGIGEGKNNTKIMVEQASKGAIAVYGVTVEEGNAADACNSYRVNGYSDWFLPSKDELNLMYVNLKKKGIGNFASDDRHSYWSSSEKGSGGAWYQFFNSGNQDGDNIRFTYRYVRPCRAF